MQKKITILWKKTHGNCLPCLESLMSSIYRLYLKLTANARMTCIIGTRVYIDSQKRAHEIDKFLWKGKYWWNANDIKVMDVVINEFSFSSCMCVEARTQGGRLFFKLVHTEIGETVHSNQSVCSIKL